MITVFANFKIDDQERFRNLKLSLNSFKEFKLLDEWVINIRGKLKFKVKDYLKKNIKNITVENYESSMGWMYDSRKLLSKINNKYIFFWIEDHVLISNLKYFENVIKDIITKKIDYLPYSFFHFGRSLKSVKCITTKSTENICYFDLNKKNHNLICNWYTQKKLRADFIIGAPSIFSKKLFSSLLKKRKPFLRRYNKFTPFDFEKRIKDTSWLPFLKGLPLKELFASIDDDHNQVNYSLINRGFLKIKTNRKKYNDYINEKFSDNKKTSIIKKLIDKVKNQI